MNVNVGDEFQKATKYVRGKMAGGYLEWSKKPDTYKQYLNGKKFKLSLPKQMETLSLDEAIQKRRSVRAFSQKSMNEEQLSYLLWASTGIQRKNRGIEFRTAPSAGALYPIETYLITNNVQGLEKAVYHYSIKSHLLEELKNGDFSTLLAHAALGQKILLNAATIFIWTAIFDRSKWKYKQRAYRYVYLDAGHIAQNLALSAAGIGLGSCQVGAFYDEEVNKIVGVDGINESTIYLSVLGYPKPM